MRVCRFQCLLLPVLVCSAFAAAQISTPDVRYKADLLLVVAHPDDDSLVSSYLARAVFDEHKRIAVVFCTHGDSGSNSVGREHARALGLVRDIEVRHAMNALGITNVWLLDGRDTSSQDVRLSLATWPSASVLEQLVRIVRLTRPEVMLTFLPSSVAGENHGDHQASGVLATEAFDMAGDPSVFPSQLAAPLRQYESAFEGLAPWQPQKLYFFSDAFDTSFFRGHGPEYEGNQISAAKHESYLQLAARSAAAYLTQMPDPQVGRQILAGDTSLATVTKMQQAGFLSEPVRLWLGKSHVPCATTGDVFDGVSTAPAAFAPPAHATTGNPGSVGISLGGFFGFYRDFWRAHALDSLEHLRPEIAVQLNDTLTIPLVIKNSTASSAKVVITAELPTGWRLQPAPSDVSVPAYEQDTVFVRVVSPEQTNDHFAEIRVSVKSGDTLLFHDSIFAEVSRYVAGQVK